MTNVNELQILRQWITATLLADSVVTTAIGKRVYNSVIPEGALAVPDVNGNPTSVWGILFNRHAGKDVKGGFAQRLYIDQYYQIKCVCTGDSFAPVNSLVNSIERLFGSVNQYQYSTSLMIVSSTREDMIEYDYNEDGVRWNYTGGLYRIVAYYNGTTLPHGTEFPDAAPGQFPDAA